MKKRAIVRLGLLLLALVNQVLVMTGHAELPIAEGDAELLISAGFTAVTAIIAAFTDNRTENKKAKDAATENNEGVR